MEEYVVTMGEKAVGKAWVERQGLYLRIRCRCRLFGEDMRKLKVYCGQQETDLGILVPVEDGFGLECRIPRKRLGEGEYRFAVLPRHGKSSGKFIPVYPEEPFAYISRLKHAHMARRNGQAGIILPDETGRFLYP